MKTIPLVNLQAQVEKLRAEFVAAMENVIDSTSYIQGDYVSKFESLFGEFHDSICIGCSNGTSAISLSLEACGIGPGDEVVTTAHTFIATAEAIVHVGAKPVFVDIDPASYTISVANIERALTSRTKAIIPVHIYGNPCDMPNIMKLAAKHQLKVIEDCAQAHLAKIDDRYIGTFGDAATYSFYPGKNLGAMGDAGCVLTRNGDVAKKVRMLLNHGRSPEKKYEHDLVGYNQRMDEFQAAILSVKWPHLKEWTAHRQKLAHRYDQRIRAAGFKTAVSLEHSQSVYHLYIVEVSNRSEVVQKLGEINIRTGVHYPCPLHLQPAFKNLNYEKGSMPVSEIVANRVVSLPICGELFEKDCDFVAEQFLKVALN